MSAVKLKLSGCISGDCDILTVTEITGLYDANSNTTGWEDSTDGDNLKVLINGKIIQNKFASDDYVEAAPLVPKSVQFLYKDPQGYHFMNLEDYHTFAVDEDTVGDGNRYLKENLEIKIRFHDDKPIVLEFPSSIVLKVVESAPGVRGDSVSNTLKPAKLETGYDISVPLFIKEGDSVKIDTRSGEYIGRA